MSPVVRSQHPSSDVPSNDALLAAIKTWSPETHAALQNLQDWFQNIVAQNEALTKTLQKMVQSVRDMVPPDFVERLEHAHNVLKYHHETYTNLAIRLQWFVPHNLPYSVVHHLVDIAESGSHEAQNVRQFFVDVFRENKWERLIDFVDDLKALPELSRGRWKILRDCAKTMTRHGTDRFNAANVVLPTIISIIDGLLNDFARRDLNISGKFLKKEDYQRMREAFEETDENSISFDEPGRVLAFDVLFESAFYGEVPPHGMSFNRHKIIHGESLRHGTAANALRAFFLVDFIVRSIHEFREAKAA